MVLKFTTGGLPYHTHPYTEAEAAEFDAAAKGPPIAILRGPAPQAPTAPAAPPSQASLPVNLGKG